MRIMKKMKRAAPERTALFHFIKDLLTSTTEKVNK